MGADARLTAERAARRDLRAAVDELTTAEIAAGLRRPNRVWWFLPVVAVIAVLVAGLGVTRWQQAAAHHSDAEYTRAAIERVSLLLSPDHRSPERVRAILAGATGGFHDEFAQSADAYSAFVKSQGTVARGVVDGAGVSGRSGDSAAVLVAATVEFGTPADGDPGGAAATRDFRLRVLITPEDGQLKLAAVQYLP